MVKVKAETVADVLDGFGVRVADKSPTALMEKLRTMEPPDDETVAELDPELAKRWKKITAALADDELEIVAQETVQTVTSVKTKVKDGKPKAKKAAAPEPRKAAKKDVETKPNGRPGVIQTIYDYLCKRSERKPGTKEEVHQLLVEKFPDRSPDSMWTTVNTQVPSRLTKERAKVLSNDKGYWIDAAPAGDHRPSKNGGGKSVKAKPAKAKG